MAAKSRAGTHRAGALTLRTLALTVGMVVLTATASFAPTYLSCTASYYNYNSSTTSKHDKSTWQYRTASAPVNPTADYARAGINVRIDIPWRSDISSGTTFTNGVNY